MPTKPAKKSQGQMDPAKLSQKKLDEIVSPYKEQDDALGFFTGVAVLVMAVYSSFLPAYIFVGPMFEVSIEENFIILSAVTIAVAIMLHTSARKLSEEQLDKISKNRGNVGSNDEQRRHQRRLQGKEATAYSIFVTNFTYLLIFSILSQQVFESLLFSYPVYNYAASALIAAIPLVAYVKGYI